MSSFVARSPGASAASCWASEVGRVTAYAVNNLADRGEFFVAPGEPVYEGQIVGEHCRENDIEVNICRAKKMTNMRAASADKTVVLKPPRAMPLEMALEFIEDDELGRGHPRRHSPAQTLPQSHRPPPGHPQTQLTASSGRAGFARL